MATYCISDIHGRMGAFHRMLEKIHFSPEDTMYVLGDVVDRGEDGVPLLLELMKSTNIHMLIGNHEYMMLNCCGPDVTEKAMRHWDRNRNQETKEKFRALPKEKQEEVLLFIRTRPDWLEIEVNGRQFHLVHGWPGDNRYDCVWKRPENRHLPNPVPGKRVVLGHTPVPYVLYQNDEDMEKYFRQLDRTGDHIEILFAKGFIDIDCGCGHTAPGCCLGCLRLDDLQTFYVATEPPRTDRSVPYEI